jgi:hypothetical protein
MNWDEFWEPGIKAMGKKADEEAFTPSILQHPFGYPTESVPGVLESDLELFEDTKTEVDKWFDETQ